MDLFGLFNRKRLFGLPDRISDDNRLFRLLDVDPDHNRNRENLNGNDIIKAAKQNPRSINSMYEFSYTRRHWFPLHQAIMLGAPIDAIESLCSDAALRARIMPKDTALLLALEQRSSLAIVKLILEKYPEAAREKNMFGMTPLHSACSLKAPLEVISLLINTWPDALQQESSFLETPLHEACSVRAPFDVILLLIEQYPEATGHKNVVRQTPFDLASKEYKTFLSYVYAIFGCCGETHHTPNEIIGFFVSTKCWRGGQLVLDKYPTLTTTMDLSTSAMAEFLSMIGNHYKLKTMWEALRNNYELFADV